MAPNALDGRVALVTGSTSGIGAATADTWRHLFEVNVIGTQQVIVAAVPHLRSGGDGSIVNVSSLAGHWAAGSSIPSAVSKAALSHLTVLLANVLGLETRVNAVAPGFVETPRAVGADEVRAFVQAPLQRAGLPQDIAGVILAHIGAGYVTGEIVVIDGGLHLR